MEPSILREGILHHLDHPVVFPSMVGSWHCAYWSLDDWAYFFEDMILNFRIGKQKEESVGPQWESGNASVAATLRQLLDWAAGRPGKRRRGQDGPSPLAALHPAEHWAYLAYKHLPLLLEHAPHLADKLGIDWSMFGFAGRGAAQSTLWIGTAGAHTLCHRDTYGLNLVVQLAGRKRWTLFPPSDSSKLYPTRVPYEESTVFSAANLRRPDFRKFPDLASTHPHTVILEPGETLLVPRHWWHLVENLETSVSINTWIELPDDDTSRLEEALVRTVISRLPPDERTARPLLNDPAEAAWPLDVCLSVLAQCADSLRRPMPREPTNQRRFWAAYRAWPGSRRVPAGPAAGLLRPDPAAETPPLSPGWTPPPLAAPVSPPQGRGIPGPEAQVGSPAGEGGEVWKALVQALTDPGVVQAAAEAFQRALRQRTGQQ